MMNPYNALFQGAEVFQLVPLSIREVIFLEKTPCDLYMKRRGFFELLMKAQTIIDRDFFKKLINQGLTQLFTNQAGNRKMIEQVETALLNATRSLSIGDHLENSTKQANLLSIHLGYVYEHPTNDLLLNTQYQTAKGLAKFLIAHTKIINQLYRELLKQKHHYVLAQPLISSLFLLGALKHSKVFPDKEIETFFITSYFKDIGMSSIPIEKYNQEVLEERDKIILSNHAKHSVNILAGRITLSPNMLKIIENHHSFSIVANKKLEDLEADSRILTGFETMIVSVMDIIAAMISPRPYRNAQTLFEALDLIKILISDQHPQEFKLIVHYFQQFFK